MPEDYERETQRVGLCDADAGRDFARRKCRDNTREALNAPRTGRQRPLSPGRHRPPSWEIQWLASMNYKRFSSVENKLPEDDVKATHRVGLCAADAGKDIVRR